MPVAYPAHDELAVFCADVGSLARGNFAWFRSRQVDAPATASCANRSRASRKQPRLLPRERRERPVVSVWIGHSEVA